MNYSDMSEGELRKLRTQKVMEVSRLNNLQMAMKILLNSAYGACG